LRGFIERTAHAAAVTEALKSLNVAPLNGPLTPVLELSEVIHKALYATHREWTKVIESDLRKTSYKDVKYEKKDNLANALPDNILKSIDKLEKRIPGTRLVYEILCEYLHPNVGDLWGATLEGEVLVDKHGTRHLIRTIGLGMKTFKGLPEQATLRVRLFDVCADIIPQMSIAIVAIETIAAKATRLTRRYAHGVVKNNRNMFMGDDICPCLSGLTVAACTGLRSS
jgi:hypothetical protein